MPLHASLRNGGPGWCPDIPDFRDYKFKDHFELRKLGDLKPVSTRSHQSPVRNQRATSSCVGHGCAGAIDYLKRIDSDKRNTIHSPSFIYAKCLEMEGSTSDDGAYVRDAIKVVTKIGSVPESKWPFIEEKICKRPPNNVLKYAERWKLGGYYRCNTLEEVCNAISGGATVIGGWACFTSLGEADRTGIVPLPKDSDEDLGGHCTQFIGHNLNHGLVEFKNSWGTSWGEQGYGYLPKEYIEDRNLSDDFWALVKEAA